MYTISHIKCAFLVITGKPMWTRVASIVLTVLLASSLAAAIPTSTCLLVKTNPQVIMDINEFEESTFGVFHNDKMSHFKRGVLIIDLGGEPVSRWGRKFFGSEKDPIFSVINRHNDDLKVNLRVLSASVPRGTYIILYVKPKSSSTKVYVIHYRTKPGILGSFNIKADGTARFWMAIITLGANPSVVKVIMRLEGSAINDPVNVNIVNYMVTFKIE